MKTRKQWRESKKPLSEFLHVGDVVDDEMFDYFLEVLPPATWTADCLQIGEPYAHIDGRPTFSTLEKIGGQWVYMGNKHQPKGVRQYQY